MSARIALVAVALLVASDAAHSQPKLKLPFSKPDAPAPTNLPPTNLPLTPAALPATSPQPLGPTLPPAPREKSVDDLLAELEDLQAQKAKLEKQEADLKAALRKKLDAQAERLKKVGVAPQPAKDKEPDRVGQIIIEGNAKTPQKKILDLVELQPGQVLPYPGLEAARVRLEKAGFRDVTVEVIPNKLDSGFKDVRVKVTEPESKPKPIVPPARD